jgi:RHS repeat-associated protein
MHLWDVLNCMTATAGSAANSGARYVYRADGMRAERVEDITLSWVENPNADDGSGFYDPVYSTNKPTTRYYYDGQMSVEEDFMETSEQTRDPYVKKYGIGGRGIDSIELWLNGAYQGIQFPIYDGHGNMIATLARHAQNGYSTENKRYYDAWGAADYESGVQANDPSQKYCASLGHVQDDESDLIYMRARYYEPSTGRFISEDPARDGTNFYCYASNRPTVNLDSSGKSDESDFVSLLG